MDVAKPKSRKIPLTQGKFTTVDETDFDWLNQWKWYAKDGQACNGTHHYAARGIFDNGIKKTILMHRFIMNCPKGKEVHHKNQDTLDNRRCNLEVLTKAENLNRRYT